MPRNCNVVASRNAQANLSKFQLWLLQTFPVCQSHHVFLSTRVHDHIQRVFQIRQTGDRSCRKQTKRPTGFQKCRKLIVPTRVGFLSPPPAQRVPPRQLEHLRSHQKIDTLDSNVHVGHRDCNLRFDEGNQVVDDRPVHNNSTCLCFHGSHRLCQNSCRCCSRDLTCQKISHVVCTSP